MNALDLLIDFANSLSTSSTEASPADVDSNHDDPELQSSVHNDLRSQANVLKSTPQDLQRTIQRPTTRPERPRPLEWTHRQEFAPSPASHEHLLAVAFAEANANMLRERRLPSNWAYDRAYFEQQHHPTRHFHDDPRAWMPDCPDRAYFEQGLAHHQSYLGHFSHEEQLRQHAYDRHQWANAYTPGCTVRLTQSHREAHHPRPTFQDAHAMMQYPVQEMGMPYEYFSEDERYRGGYMPVQEQREFDWRHEGQVWT
jgi:hypothetical protein